MKSATPPPSIPDHELLRVVGRGSYGEVWLARNVMGVLRAVKVIHRSSFDSDRPFDREFKGIERYEPLSRTSDGLVQILHVGRNLDAGFFYYVMELADDAAGAADRLRDPGGMLGSSYVPRTLRLDLERMGRLPVEECVEIGRSLATGLSQLHRHRLVHRDLKPSNIVFVGGRAKLADLGLVAGLGESRSFVGTEGFVPPEGPGRPAADLFGLGRVLFQAVTGLEPGRFPEIPPDWLEAPDASALIEFHEVVLKLGESDSRRRYQEATEVLADLAVIQSGRSVRELRALRRRVATLRGLGIVALAGLFMAGLVGAWARREARREHENFLRVSAAERSARSELVHAKLAQAKAMRLAGGVDARDQILRVLTHAMTLAPDPVQRLALRTEAVAALAHTGIRWVPAPAATKSFDPMAVALDLNQEWSIRHERDGELVVRSDADAAPLARLAPLNPVDDEVVGFSPSRRFVLLRRGETFIVGDLERGVYCRTNGACGFTAGDDLWCATPSGGLQRVHLPGGEVRQELGPSAKDPGAPRPWTRVAPAPVGNRVAVARLDEMILVWDMESGEVSERLKAPDGVYSLAWSATARQFAAGTIGGEVRVWELPDPEARWTLPIHATAVRRLAFDPTGGILAAAVEGEALRLLDAGSGREIANLMAVVWRGGEPGFIELLPPESVRAYPRARAAVGDGVLGFDPGGRWLAVGTTAGLGILDAEAGRWQAHFPGREVRSMAFDEARHRLLWLDDFGLASVPWRNGTGAPAGEIVRAPGRGWTHFARAARSDTMLLADGAGEFLRLQVTNQPPVDLPTHQFVRFTAVTPDGRMGASGNLSERDVQLWDLSTGRAAGRVASGLNVRPVFSPDARWLATVGPTCRLWTVPGGDPGPDLPSGPANTVYGSAAFSPDASQLAVVFGDREIRLFQLPGAVPGLTLEAPSGERIVALAFAPDNRRLAAATVEGDVFTWDLVSLERRLAELGLRP